MNDTATLRTRSGAARYKPGVLKYVSTTGQTITIDRESAVVASATNGRGGARITLSAALTAPHEKGAQVSGSGLTLTAPLAKPHAAGSPVSDKLPTPGAGNR